MTSPSPEFAPPQPAQALLGLGQVRHLRLRPAANGFEYPTWFLLLPMRQLRAQPSPVLRRNRWGWASFHDRDHGDGRPDSLAWLDELLARHGLKAPGEVWLHTYPRVWGFTFKPVSFWYCHQSNGALAAIVAEVNNTFGERHTYLLDSPNIGWGRELRADKALQVSPFCRIEGGYRFRFMRAEPATSHGPQDAGRTVARIDYHDPQGLLLSTSVSGRLMPLTAQNLRGALWRMPLLTLGVVARIHWQAAKLWAKRVPFVGKLGRVDDKLPAPHPR